MLEDFDQTGSDRARRRVRRRRLAPWATAAVLGATLAFGVATAPRAVDVAPYFARVARRLGDVPYSVGSWVGRDVEVVPAARELLRPNGVLQRRYQSLEDGSWFNVLLVHCGDVRDMQGHYPPVCYPNAGWAIRQQSPTSAPVGPEGVPATEYLVEFQHDRSVPSMRIVNFFAMPGDGVQYAREMGALNQAARSGATAQMGVLQVQVLTPVEMDPATRQRLLPVVWSMIEPVVREVVEGPDADF